MVENTVRSKWQFSKGNMICMSQAKFFLELEGGVCVYCFRYVEYNRLRDTSLSANFYHSELIRFLEAFYQNQESLLWSS